MAALPDPHPQTPIRGPRGGRRRAVLILTAAALGVLAVVVGLVAALLPNPPDTPSPPEGALAPPAPVDTEGWDVAAQTELASRPMPVLPEAAAFPHELSSASAAPPIRLPAAGTRSGPVPRGYPPTPQGALAQLAALTDTGLVNADPQVYATAYAAVAAPGAPPATDSRLYRDLVGVRAQAGLPPVGAAPEVSFDWTATSGLIKGSTDGGRYVVACVLGQLDAGANGRVISTGAGDCQGMRWVDGQWWISPGVAAAAAPLAWPGSPEAVQVGYRAVTGA